MTHIPLLFVSEAFTRFRDTGSSNASELRLYLIGSPLSRYVITMSRNMFPDVESLIEELERNSQVLDITVEKEDVYGTEIAVLYDRRELPMGFLQLVSDHGDLRVEGTDGSHTELLIIV